MLDRMNQIIVFYYTTKSTNQDFSIYSTETVVVSSLCKFANQMNCRFVLNKCNWYLTDLLGADVAFRESFIRNNSMAIDFTSMYSNIMVSSNTSTDL